MDIKVPKLFKYRYFNENSVSRDGTENGEKIPQWQQVLYDGLIFPVAPETFNDPYDCNFSLDSSFLEGKLMRLSAIEGINKNYLYQLTDEEKLEILNSKNVRRALEKALKHREPNTYKYIAGEIIKEYENVIKEAKSILKVACFSETNDSILMWSHYANNHSGFCIEYDFNSWELKEWLAPVHYIKERHKLQAGDIDEKMDLSDLGKVIRSEALYKADVWNYEKEWRIIFAWSKEGKPTKYQNPKFVYELKDFITGVYLGANVDDCLRNQVFGHFKGTTVKVYQMIMKEDEYKLVAERIS